MKYKNYSSKSKCFPVHILVTKVLKKMTSPGWILRSLKKLWVIAVHVLENLFKSYKEMVKRTTIIYFRISRKYGSIYLIRTAVSVNLLLYPTLCFGTFQRNTSIERTLFCYCNLFRTQRVSMCVLQINSVFKSAIVVFYVINNILNIFK